MKSVIQLSTIVVLGLLAVADVSHSQVCRLYNTWTSWYDRDNPSGLADYEALKELREENPGQICAYPSAIQGRIRGTTSKYRANNPHIVFNRYVGLICWNAGGPCRDYEVRFCCRRRRSCPGNKWTKWYDRDNPSGNADYEVLSNLRSENPGKICEKPILVQARIRGTTTLYHDNDPNIAFNAQIGLACWNNGNNRCKDYEVRFCCP